MGVGVIFLSLFYFFGGRKTDRAGLGGGCIPRRWRPQPPAHPERLHSTGQQRRPCQMQGRPPTAGRAPTHTPKRWTRCTGLHSIPDRPRRADRTGGGCWRAWSVSETEQIRTRTSRLAPSHIFVMFCCLCNCFALYKVTQV